LIVATNVLVYYDFFEQSLAMANIARMLKPGGFLLSNTALMEFPGSPLNTIDFLKVDYWNDRPDDCNSENDFARNSCAFGKIRIDRCDLMN